MARSTVRQSGGNLIKNLPMNSDQKSIPRRSSKSLSRKKFWIVLSVKVNDDEKVQKQDISSKFGHGKKKEKKKKKKLVCKNILININNT